MLPDENELNESPGGEELAPSDAVELAKPVADVDEQPGLANARIAELEQTVAGLESELANRQQSLAESGRQLAQVSGALSQAVASYRA